MTTLGAILGHRRFFLPLVVWLTGLLGTSLYAAPDAASALEQEIAGIVAGPKATVVHFWAPWCPNCHAEMTPGGWAKFVEANPEVKFVFLNVWHRDQDPAPLLATAKLGGQPNLILRTHPNATSRDTGDRTNSFLGLPLTWLPTTWIYREGKLRVAFNYGEIRFPVLQQMVDDTTGNWNH